MRILLTLLLSAVASLGAVTYPPGTVIISIPGSSSIADNTSAMRNAIGVSKAGSIIQLGIGTFDITNTPIILPAGVTLQGVGTNATIIRNWIRGDGAITGRGCGILPGNNCTIQYLQITNALAQTNYQGCIGAITPQPIFTDLVTRGLWCRGSSDCYQVSQETAFTCNWSDYSSIATSKWDTVVFICNDQGNAATVGFHSYGSTFISTGPAASGSNTAHGLYIQADFIDVVLDQVTLKVLGNSANRAWEIAVGLDDTSGSFLLRNCTVVGTTVNAGSMIPFTNTFTLSLDSSSRNGINLTNITYLGLAGVPTNTPSIYASGTAYTLTGSSAALDFGTTDPNLTLSVAGTYLIVGNIGVKYSGATYVAAQTITFKFRRTNNTAADLSNGSRAVELPVLTTFTGGDVMALPPVIYTATAGDIVTIFGILSATPSAGSVVADSAELVAIRIY